MMSTRARSRAGGTHILVMAKEPVPGRVKTRLCPPCTPAGAARVAAAALADTLEAVAGCGADRRILALDGEPGPWLPPAFEVVPQIRGPFAERLAAAWAHAGGPGLQIGMDTPQVTPKLLDAGLDLLDQPGLDAVLAPACDGGWWAIGQRRPHPGAFVGVPMSTGHTADRQRRRLAELGLATAELPVLRDIDDIADAIEVSRQIPRSRTARAVWRALGPEAEPDPADLVGADQP